MGFILGYAAGQSENIGRGVEVLAEACQLDRAACENDLWWWKIFMIGMITLLALIMIAFFALAFRRNANGRIEFDLPSKGSSAPPRPPKAPAR